MAEPFTALIMAAGHGTRMRSELPKVLHPVCGKPMVGWVIDAAREAGAEEVVCVTRPGEGVDEGLPEDVTVAEQTEGEGTGAAVLAARGQVPDGRPLAVLSGDHPLVAAEVIAGLVATHAEADADGHRPHHREPRPGGLRARDARRGRATSTASSRPSAPRACPRRCWPTARSTSAPTSSSPRTLFAALERGRGAGRRALPHRRHHRLRRRAAGGHQQHHRRRRGAGRQQPSGPDGGRAASPAGKLIAEHAAERGHLRRARTVELHAGVTIGEDTRIGVGA